MFLLRLLSIPLICLRKNDISPSFGVANVNGETAKIIRLSDTDTLTYSIYPGEGNDTLEGSTEQDTIIQ